MKGMYIFILLILYIEISLQFTLTSEDIKNGQPIPEKHSKYSLNQSPGFEWDEPPEGTKSFAFTVEDPDCPKKYCPEGPFYHWILINIKKNIRKIKPKKRPGLQVINSSGKYKYYGPKPPKGQTHNYHFVLYALDTERLYYKSYKEFHKNIRKHTIKKIKIVAPFNRNMISPEL